MSRLVRPILLYDGHCGFCRAWIARWQRATGDAVDYAPSQALAERFPDIAPERYRDSVVLMEPGGRVCFGAEAVLRALAEAPGRGLGLWLYERVPGFAAATELAYRLVARHRTASAAVTRLVWGRHVVPPGDRVTAWIFLRLLAVVYLMAFASLGSQIVGLVGTQGVLPIGGLLEAAAQRVGPERFWLLPTLSWWNAGDAFLRLQCLAGGAAAALLFLGVAPIAMLVLLRVLYLSVATAGQDFLWFQWDSLLLEAGVLGVFLAPWRWWSRPAKDPAPSRAALWMLRWLLFRLMFSSAAVKLSSGDPTWRDLTALRYHYETQPLPPWPAWYAHQLPVGIQRASAAGMFCIEGLVPFLIFAPRRLRMAGALVLACFQGLLIVTGNYGFFNYLTIALCVLLMDDGAWPAWVHRLAGGTAPPRRIAPGAESGVIDAPNGDSANGGGMRWPGSILRPALALLFVLSLVPLVGSFRRPVPWLRPVALLYRALSPLELTNPYGLFAVMTTSRPEIVVEGSQDGLTWRPYDFRWKPGDTLRAPAFVAPHQPRLDWQMWFAALDTRRIEPWFVRLCQRLLEGSKPVLELLERNPFPDRPPRFIRAVVYDYHFTDFPTRRSTHAWWRRTPKGTYVPPLTLVDGRLAPVEFSAAPR